jgi:hypothetical protein
MLPLRLAQVPLYLLRLSYSKSGSHSSPFVSSRRDPAAPSPAPCEFIYVAG